MENPITIPTGIPINAKRIDAIPPFPGSCTIKAAKKVNPPNDKAPNIPPITRPII